MLRPTWPPLWTWLEGGGGEGGGEDGGNKVTVWRVLSCWVLRRRGGASPRCDATLAGSLWDDRHTPGRLQPGKARQRRGKVWGRRAQEAAARDTRQAVWTRTLRRLAGARGHRHCHLACGRCRATRRTSRRRLLAQHHGSCIVAPKGYKDLQQHRGFPAAFVIQNNARRRLPVTFFRAPYDLVRVRGGGGGGVSVVCGGAHSL